jgi:hypothetical protein
MQFALINDRDLNLTLKTSRGHFMSPSSEIYLVRTRFFKILNLKALRKLVTDEPNHFLRRSRPCPFHKFSAPRIDKTLSRSFFDH